MPLLAHQSLGAAQAVAGADEPIARVQRLADQFRERLAISGEVVVQVVDRDPLVASVRPMAGREGVFLLSFERAFLASLTEEDLAAVVAHELGHVWIYAHHPYLQTEQLANAIAMRVVTREDLERLYARLWGAGALTCDLAGFLGLSASAPPPPRTPSS